MSDDEDISLTGRAIALAVAENDSLGEVLQESGMEMPEFIVLSFVSDQGPISCVRLARLIGLDLDATSRCISRLTNAGLLVSDVLADPTESDVVATDPGNRIAEKLLSQL
jgi:DNA-binding MarR family transcriptional regulator